MRDPKFLAPWLAVLAALSCGQAPSPAPPKPPSVAATEGLTITLSWGPAVDLDLYVTDPTQETVYFANPRAESGGRLERDQGCPKTKEGDAPRMEVVRWTAPPPGVYRVGVDYGDRCGASDREVAYRLVASAPGLDREITGVVRFKAFVYQALEIERPAAQSPAR